MTGATAATSAGAAPAPAGRRAVVGTGLVCCLLVWATACAGAGTAPAATAPTAPATTTAGPASPTRTELVEHDTVTTFAEAVRAYSGTAAGGSGPEVGGSASVLVGRSLALLGADALLLHDLTTGEVTASAVRGLPAGDGAVRVTPAPVTGVSADGGTVVAAGFGGTVAASGTLPERTAVQLVVLDVGTGATVADVVAPLAPVADDTETDTDAEADAATVTVAAVAGTTAAVGLGTTLRGVSLADGTTTWTLDGVTVLGGHDGQVLVRARRDPYQLPTTVEHRVDRLEVVDVATGVVVRTVGASFALLERQQIREGDVRVDVGGTLVSYASTVSDLWPGTGEGTVTQVGVYDWTTGQELVRTRHVGEDGTVVTYRGCLDDGLATVVCATGTVTGGADGQVAGLSGLDRTTGAARWAFTADDGRVVPELDAARHGVVYGATADAAVMLDAATGLDRSETLAFRVHEVNGYGALAVVGQGADLTSWPRLDRVTGDATQAPTATGTAPTGTPSAGTGTPYVVVFVPASGPAQTPTSAPTSTADPTATPRTA